MSRPVLVEACVESVESALAAHAGGASRLELCASLADGGTTPSAGMLAAVKEHLSIPVVAIIRPRGGDFVYSRTELDVMRREIDVTRSVGVDGLVLGALTPDARVDEQRMAELLALAGNTPVTFHRAFDLVVDLDEALDTLVALGVERVLTSGGAATAVEGIEALARAVRRADGRIAVMAGGGIREENVADVVRRTGVSEVHVRGTRTRQSDMRSAHVQARFRKALPTDDGVWEETDTGRIREIVALANGSSVGRR